MKKSILIALFLMAGFTAPAFAEESAYDRVIAKNEIICGVCPWPPYKVLDPNTGEWSGFAIDMYRKIFATLDIKVKFKEFVLGTQVEDLNTGRLDAICDDGPFTMSAGKFVEFANPIYVTVSFPYVRKDDDRFKSRADFNNEKIVFTGIDGDISTDLVKRLFPKAKLLSMPGTTDASQLLLNVMTKKADVAISDAAAFEAFNKAHPNKLKLLFRDHPLGMYKNTISVKKGDMKMLGLVNQAVDNGLAFGIVDDVLDEFDPKHEKLMRVRLPYEF